MTTPPRVVQGYLVRAGQVLAIAEFLDRQTSQYWGSTRAAVIRAVHARLKELCVKWDRGSIDVREGHLCIQSDGEINRDGNLSFEIFIDMQRERTAAWALHRIVPKAPETRVRRALGGVQLRVLTGGKK
jgi:hypothetical protein